MKTLKEIFTREGAGSTLVTVLLTVLIVAWNFFYAGFSLAQGHWQGWILFGVGIIVAMMMSLALMFSRDTAYYIGKRHVYEERIDRELARGLGEMKSGRDFGFTRGT